MQDRPGDECLGNPYLPLASARPSPGSAIGRVQLGSLKFGLKLGTRNYTLLSKLGDSNVNNQELDPRSNKHGRAQFMCKRNYYGVMCSGNPKLPLASTICQIQTRPLAEFILDYALKEAPSPL